MKNENINKLLFEYIRLCKIVGFEHNEHDTIFKVVPFKKSTVAGIFTRHFPVVCIYSTDYGVSEGISRHTIDVILQELKHLVKIKEMKLKNKIDYVNEQFDKIPLYEE